jgi:hypothetical protein
MGSGTDHALQAIVGFKVETIELCGFVRLTLADPTTPVPTAPDNEPRTLYRIPIESPFHVLDAETDTLVRFQPWNERRASGLNELADLFLATINEATGVEYRTLTLKLTTQYSQQRILHIDNDPAGHETWHLERLR